jgi:hypothetical protein
MSKTCKPGAASPKPVPARITVRLNPRAHEAMTELVTQYPKAPISELVNRIVIVAKARKEALLP